MIHDRSLLLLVVIFAAGYATAAAQVAWDSSNVGNAVTLSDIVMPAISCGYAIGDNGTIAKSTDGGLTWTQQMSNTTIGLVTVAFADTLRGWVAGSNVLRYTTNGGTSWLTPQTSPSLGANSIAFGRPDIGVAVGVGGQIIRTTDGGVNWAMVVSGVSQSLFGVTFADSVDAVAVGNNRILRSTDGGQSWSRAWTPVALLWDVTAASEQLIVAVGTKSSPTRGVVFRSTDGGAQWDSVDVVSGTFLKAVSFCSPDSGYTLSSTGAVYRTVDGGTSWDSVTVMPLGAGVTSIAVSSPRTGMISGARGMVYYSKTGFVGVSEAARFPNQPALHQNFPNPFNPSTTIGFVLPRRGVVALTVFNPLGQKLSILVEGEQEAGYHDVRFDGSHLSSGVYLYRLQAGDFVQTRKLLLLR